MEQLIISDYNPQWIAEYEQEKQTLATQLRDIIVGIEHIGSTAVPGLAAKPLIDIMLVCCIYMESKQEVYDMEQRRCGWVNDDPLYMDYHDKEWGVPVHADTKLFELLVLEGAQAGLSWYTVLKKRDNYRRAFDGFDPHKVAAYDEAKVAELLGDAGIIRNRLKVQAAITNAQVFMRVQQEFGSFDAYIWRFVGGEPIRNHWHSLREVPATTPQSDAMSKDLKKRGFKFVGSTICYAFMQASGMVNDHTTECMLYSRTHHILQT
jgi:DNA-3-methyladenine glycosylase I